MRASVFVIVLAACAKAPDACPDLRVTIDGAPLPALTNGHAFSFKVNGVTEWVVDVSSMATSCDKYMAAGGRILRAGERNVSASLGVTMTVGIANMSVASDRVSLVGAPPSKPGDKLALCVENASFTGDFDVYKDKTIVIDGRLEGTYCGEQKR